MKAVREGQCVHLLKASIFQSFSDDGNNDSYRVVRGRSVSKARAESWTLGACGITADVCGMSVTLRKRLTQYASQ